MSTVTYSSISSRVHHFDLDDLIDVQRSVAESIGWKTPTFWLEVLLEEYGITFSRVSGDRFEDRLDELGVPASIAAEMGDMMRRILNHKLPWTSGACEGPLLRGSLTVRPNPLNVRLTVYEHDRLVQTDPLELLMEQHT